MTVDHSLCMVATMWFGSTTKLLAKRMLKYWRIPWWVVQGGVGEADSGPQLVHGVHREILKYYHSTSSAYAEVLQNLIMGGCREGPTRWTGSCSPVDQWTRACACWHHEIILNYLQSVC